MVSSKFCSSFIKKRFFTASLVLLIFLFCTLSASAQLTAYKHYNDGLGAWDYTLSTSSVWTDIYGSGSINHLPVGKGDFPATNPTFGGCVEFIPSTVLYHHDYDGVIWNDAEGTISVWVAPNWNGENQGGDHPNGTANNIIIGDGIAEIPCTQGFNILFFDNNYGPTPGYQLFVCYTDSGGAVIYENYALGNTMDWIAGDWHHICVSWDATEVMAGLDGVIFMKNVRNGGFNFADGGYLFGMNRAGGPENSWDGWADELAVYDTALYTGYGNVGDPYPVPTEPIITSDPNILRAGTPRPSDGETGVDRRTDLSWLAGYGAVSHDVYFGTSYDDVNNANNSGPSGPGYVYRGNQDPCNYTIPEIPLALNTTYFWRVDEVGNDAPRGKVWSFTTSEKDLPAGFLVLGNTVPPEYDPPVIPGGYTEQLPDTNITPLSTTPEENTRGYLTYVKSYLNPIYPITIPTRPEVTDQLSIFSTINEYELGTFTIYAINNMTDVSVSISDLTGQSGTISTDNIEIRSVRCWPRKVWAQPKYIQEPSFLEKRATLDINAGSSKRYWITVYVPADTKAGTYTGTVSIVVSNRDNYTLDFELEVLGIQLLTAPTTHMMYYNPTYMTSWPDPLPPERLRKDIKNMEEHGMNSVFVTYPTVCVAHKDAGGQVMFNLDPMHPFGEACQRSGFGPIVYNMVLSELISSQLGDWATMIIAYNNGFVNRGWPSLIASVADEADADPERTALAQTRLAYIKNNVPGMQTFQNIVYPENSELFEPDADIRAFSSYVDDTVVAPTRAAGRELWQYSGTAGYGLDVKGDRLYRGIWASKLTLDASLAWTYYHPVLDPAQPYQDLFVGATRNNMTAWVWPTDDGPLPSPGWEGTREGIEDKKYIHTLTTLIDKARETGYSYPAGVADAAELYLNSLYAQIDTSPRIDDSVFPIRRESDKLTADFFDFRYQFSQHIKALNISLGDINGDFNIDYKDVALMAENWLLLYDFENFALLAANWKAELIN